MNTIRDVFVTIVYRLRYRPCVLTSFKIPSVISFIFCKMFILKFKTFWPLHNTALHVYVTWSFKIIVVLFLLVYLGAMITVSGYSGLFGVAVIP